MTDIFDDLVANRTDEVSEATEPTNAPAEASDTNASEWPKRVTLAAGERPEGSLTVAEFSEVVNKQLVKERVEQLMADGASPLEAAMEAMTAQVSQASFYQSVKAQRNPMPHYIVTYEVAVVGEDGAETGEVKSDEKTFIPTKIALDWWKNRPTRGAGAGRSSEEDLGKRLYRAGKKIADLKAAQERLVKLTENVKRMEGQVEDYQKRLEADGKTLDDATTAYEAQVEKDEAEKAIADNE